MGLSFFKIDEETFAIGPHLMHEYLQPNPELSITEAPTAEQFMAAAFWEVYFDSFNYTFYFANETFRGDFRDTSEWGHVVFIDCAFYGEIEMYWDQQGARYLVKQISDSDEYLKKVLDYELGALQKRYGSDSVEFENVVGKLPRLHIKYSDKPFEWIYTATPRQITEFAQSLYEDVCALRLRIEKRIDGIVERQAA
jgi:hypothetical protein